jgi:hypothetical protein
MGGDPPAQPALKPRWLWIAFAVIVLAIPVIGLFCENMR